MAGQVEALPSFFPEFRPYLSACKFGAVASMIASPVCAIREAVDNGHISEARYLSYLKLAEDVA